jgi:hypothetical protein
MLRYYHEPDRQFRFPAELDAARLGAGAAFASAGLAGDRRKGVEKIARRARQTVEPPIPSMCSI